MGFEPKLETRLTCGNTTEADIRIPLYPPRSPATALPCGTYRTATGHSSRPYMGEDPPDASAASQPIARLTRGACCQLRYRLSPALRSHTPYRPGTRSRRRIGSGFPATQVAEGLNEAAGSGPLSAGEPIAATALRQNRAAAWRISGRIRVMSPQAVRLRRRFCQGWDEGRNGNGG